ncbi:SDR family NAD(P)-dependent oxidoreductase [Dietzia cinnamea]|uniref:SDR family NAD(P)-dependent oxidoreductase n=1 Tax=Dietzia cinnamea TaxID=321318 RepID=A0ABV3YG66_9ACTN|nr:MULTISPECIES: SDR family NAD(P)-dependent oxidoreductase [Dietzia]MCT1885457.1 SDR family NAD(P)-dependent oxidoreductase [Dietzia cinnamea]MCT2058121.1 SDR family NAD(P)-dependent oxidoreductase [Dietzia cinnamea]MCT2120994.1 SDR family NAD(P)-dependent oxidoreductase [Dietzia cinnamea]MCT2144810.1 SDR family NAD(P)-dependent oxidoreductase [Dietzia cinnamea]MCT2304698.1 SDR family NAD(P)-dependent oxidoreductase [Dietzia cinnamea]
MSARVALVTGGSRGVGRGVATALADAGWDVFVTGRAAERLQSTVDAADGAPGRIRALECDHSRDEEILAVVTRIADETGRLDLLVNNAWTNPEGFVGFNGRFWERPTTDWDALMGVGLRAHYVASCEATKVMVPQGSGLMVNISSFGSRAPFHTVLYGMSKTALDKMASDMAHELAGTGVSTLSLWLGLIRTEVLLSTGMEDFNGFPLARAEDPAFVGRVIAALADDPDLGRMSGSTVITAEYGREKGIRNDDGEVPLSHRGAFGGGPLFPPVTDEQLGIETVDEVAAAGGHNGFTKEG